MESIIKELWHGNIIPQEDSRTNSKEMKELLRYMSQEEGYAARGENCANRSTLVRILANISPRRRYREYSVPAVCEPSGFVPSDCDIKIKNNRAWKRGIRL